MKRLQDFFDALSTKGGNICILMASCVLLAILYLHLVHHHDDAQAIEAIATTLSGFTGALLLACSGNSSRQQMIDRAESVSPKVDASQAKQVNVASTLEQNPPAPAPKP